MIRCLFGTLKAAFHMLSFMAAIIVVLVTLVVIFS